MKIGSVAITIEKNHPIYGNRLGVRVLNPFREHGAGLHIGSVLVHLHTNYSPLYGQGLSKYFYAGKLP
jgi:hypothetical protein